MKTPRIWGTGFNLFGVFLNQHSFKTSYTPTGIINSVVLKIYFDLLNPRPLNFLFFVPGFV